jgi:hypothetical protein
MRDQTYRARDAATRFQMKSTTMALTVAANSARR